MARVERMAWLGGTVKLSLKLSDGAPMTVEMPKAEVEALWNQRGRPGDGQPARRQGLPRGLLDLRLTTRTRYAIRALYDLAFHAATGATARAKEIAERQGIPFKFLEQILQDLRRAGLVEARRGPHGGYVLARPPAEISMADVLRAVRGPLEELLGVGATPGAGDIPSLVWGEVGERLIEVLEATTLADFVSHTEAAGLRRAVAPATCTSSDERRRIDEDILVRIGRTPLVRLRRLAGPGSADVLCKCEQFNPGGSVKDRTALAMVEAAEREGRLVPGQSILVEATSGNTGIGLALVAAVKGYRLILTMPENMSPERMELLRAYGAELHLTPAERVMRGAVEKAAAIAATNPNAFMPEQFRNPVNPVVHRTTTGAEILAQLGGARPTRSWPASAPAARSPAWAGPARAAPGRHPHRRRARQQRGAVRRLAGPAPHPGHRRRLRPRNFGPNAADRSPARQRGRGGSHPPRPRAPRRPPGRHLRRRRRPRRPGPGPQPGPRQDRRHGLARHRRTLHRDAAPRAPRVTRPVGVRTRRGRISASWPVSHGSP